MNPDTAMAHYWLERERRERGEHTGLRALAPVLSGIVSECCAAKVSTNRLGELVCSKCNGECWGQSWHAARAESQRGDPLCLQVDDAGESLQTMLVHETRTIDRSREDRQRAAEADRFLQFARLAALIEPRPRAPGPIASEARWVYMLHAYGWSLTLGIATTIEIGHSCAAHLEGSWSEDSVRRACAFARDVLGRRLERPRTKRWRESAAHAGAIGA